MKPRADPRKTCLPRPQQTCTGSSGEWALSVTDVIESCLPIGVRESCTPGEDGGVEGPWVCMPTGPLTSQTRGVTFHGRPSSPPLWTGDTGICCRLVLRIAGNPQWHEIGVQLMAVATVMKFQEVHFSPIRGKSLLYEKNGGRQGRLFLPQERCRCVTAFYTCLHSRYAYIPTSHTYICLFTHLLYMRFIMLCICVYMHMCTHITHFITHFIT